MQQKQSQSWRKWTILIAIGIVQFVGNFTQYQMSPIAARIMEELGLNATEYASAFSAPMAPAVFFSLVVGIVVDKLGVKKPVALALSVTVVGLVLRVFAFNYAMLYLSLFLIGFGIMLVNVNGSKILSQWFPKEKVGILLGVALAMASAGQAAALVTGALFPSTRASYLFAVVLGCFSLGWWLVFGKDKEPSDKEAATQEAAPPIGQCLKVVLKNRYMWICGLCMMMTTVGGVAVASMMPSALATRGVDSVAAGVVSSAFTIGGLVGCILVPSLVSRFGGRRRLILAVLSVIYIFGILFGWRAPIGVPLFAVMFVTGICMGGMGPVMTAIPLQLPEIGPLYAGTAGGVISTLQLLGPVVVLPYIITPAAGGDFHRYFAMAAVCVVILLVLCFFLPASVAKTLRHSSKKKK